MQLKNLRVMMDLAPQRGGSGRLQRRNHLLVMNKSQNTKGNAATLPYQTVADSVRWVVLTSFLHSARRRRNGMTCIDTRLASSPSNVSPMPGEEYWPVAFCKLTLQSSTWIVYFKCYISTFEDQVVSQRILTRKEKNLNCDWLWV